MRPADVLGAATRREADVAATALAAADTRHRSADMVSTSVNTAFWPSTAHAFRAWVDDTRAAPRRSVRR
jgi:hypothetical protein